MVGTQRTRRLAVLAVALLAGGGLSGCTSVAHPGAAAEVGTETISVSYVQKQLQEILDESSKSRQGQTSQASQAKPSVAELAENQRGLLQQLIYNNIIVATGDRLGVTVSQTDVNKVKGEIKAQQVFIPADMLDDFARWVALRRELDTNLLGKTPSSQAQQTKADQMLGKEMAKTARRVGVTVNPRYGVWNGSQLVPGGELVTPAPAAPGGVQPQGPSAP